MHTSAPAGCTLFYLLGQLLLAGTELFVRGDATADRRVSLADAVRILDRLFLDPDTPLGCPDAADANDDGGVDIADPLHVLFFLFAGGEPPPAPYPACGPDETEDHLGCPTFLPCGTPSRITNSINMELVFIPAGTFLMGSPITERGRNLDLGFTTPVPPDETRHQVTLTCDFYMSTMEITQGQFKTIMGFNPSYYQGSEWGTDLRRPVDWVGWGQCQEFLKRLSASEGLPYRLPTEAEWEYACRAGTSTRFSFGDALECDDVCCFCELPDHYMWWCGNTIPTHPVGQKKPNPWGLHDMHGNVPEFCQDWYGPYPTTAVIDPRGPPFGVVRIVRGGADWRFRRGRSAARGGSNALSEGGGVIGFRVAASFCRS